MLASGMSAHSYARILGANDRIRLGQLGCGDRSRSYHSGISFIHATDPHVFLYTAQAQKTKDVGGKQQSLDEKAQSRSRRRSAAPKTAKPTVTEPEEERDERGLF